MKVAFYTLGCKVNQYETDIMKKQFKDSGYQIVEFDEKADVYVINSCSVTNLATRKTRQYISRAKKSLGVVVLCGCYAQEIKEDKQNLKNVDIILGNEEKKDIVKYIEEYIKTNKKVYKISNIEDVKKYVQKVTLDEGINIRESIKIEDGCNNFCSYCIIPYLRGRVRSRNIDQIKAEVKKVALSGVKEVVLVGIEIASYGKDLDCDLNLIDVVEQISDIDGIERIRLGSIEPRILTDENIIRLSKVKKLCNHFHISVQSLDDTVLKKMNRKYDSKYVVSTIEKLRKYFDDPAITCDIIVGFPEETDEEFLNTYNMAKKIGFSDIHVFKYSKRKYTKAASNKNQVDGNVKNYRSEELIKLASKLKEEYMKKYIGKTEKVLFESYSKDGYLEGYTSNYLKVKVRGDRRLWAKVLEVELLSIDEDLILGKL